MRDVGIAFAADGLDRADHVRADQAQLATMQAHGDARLLAMEGLSPVLEDEALVWLPLDSQMAAGELVFLGLDNGAPRFAVPPEHGDIRPAFQQRTSREALARLSSHDLAIYGAARSLVDWHARHRFCANCGAPSMIGKGGWQRNCGNATCAAQHFPRVDPVAIMLVEHDGDLLLGRGRDFPPKLYSALAGFIEPGETIEHAVAREVLEEVGVAVRDVTYIASQPWPFPSQLMIGCHCHAESRELTIDETEIADARWFTREQITEAVRAGKEGGEGVDGFRPPLTFAIAAHLLAWWLDGTDDQS